MSGAIAYKRREQRRLWKKVRPWPLLETYTNFHFAGATDPSQQLFRFCDLDRSRFSRARRIAHLRVMSATCSRQSLQFPGKSSRELPSGGLLPLSIASIPPLRGLTLFRQRRPSTPTGPHAVHAHRGQSSSDSCSDHSSQEQPHCSQERDIFATTSTGNDMARRLDPLGSPCCSCC
jgi:hypothetical protein